MSNFLPKDKNFTKRVHDSFDRQLVMQTLGITMTGVSAGKVELEMPFDQKFTQQHGFLHAGIISTALDSACGYAAFSLMDIDAAVLTIEFKINLLAPARGIRFRFVGEVIKSGRTITVCDGKAYCIDGDTQKLIATMNGTLMAVTKRNNIAQ